MKKRGLFLSVIFVVFLLVSCKSNANEVLPASDGPTTSSTFNASPTITPTPTPSPTKTKVPFVRLFDPAPTKDAIDTQTPVEFSQIGTALPESNQAITSENINNLAQVGQWGYGTIRGAAFTPDGSKFVIGSAFGFAIYDMHDLQSQPVWTAFNQPHIYRAIEFDETGNYMRLTELISPDVVLEFPSGKEITPPREIKWIAGNAQGSDYGQIESTSPNGIMQLQSYSYNADEENVTIDYSRRYVKDPETDQELYDLPDETYFYHSRQYRQEGYDVSYFSMSNSPPSSFHPYEAAFAPDNSTFSIIYRPHYGIMDDKFSFMRVYQAGDGSLIENIGSLSDPIMTFAYEPAGSRILIAHTNGSIQLWDTKTKNITFTAWHFSGDISSIEYTNDNKYVLIQRNEYLEVREAKTGSLRSRVTSYSYALSPIDNNILVYSDDGYSIKIMALNSGKTIRKIENAHDDLILSIAVSDNGLYISSAGMDGNIKLWDYKTGEFLHYFEETIASAERGPAVPLADYQWNSLIFINDFQFIEGKNQLLGFNVWGNVVNWNVDSGATNYVIYNAPIYFNSYSMDIYPHSPENFAIDIPSNTLTLDYLVYDLDSGEKIENLDEMPLPDNCSGYDPLLSNGEVILSLGYQANASVCILSADQHELIHILMGFPISKDYLSVIGYAFSKDNTQLITVTNVGTINIYKIME